MCVTVVFYPHFLNDDEVEHLLIHLLAISLCLLFCNSPVIQLILSVIYGLCIACVYVSCLRNSFLFWDHKDIFLCFVSVLHICIYNPPGIEVDGMRCIAKRQLSFKILLVIFGMCKLWSIPTLIILPIQ